jgi:hypothetical protein
MLPVTDAAKKAFKLPRPTSLSGKRQRSAEDDEEDVFELQGSTKKYKPQVRLVVDSRYPSERSSLWASFLFLQSKSAPVPEKAFASTAAQVPYQDPDTELVRVCPFVQ